MINMFDYKKYSVQEYSTILHQWFLGKPPLDENIFKYEIQYVKRNVGNLLITFKNNHWIKVDTNGWWCEAYCDDTQDVISNRHFYQTHRSSESLGLGHVAYTSRPSKGITYKNIVLKGSSIVRNDHNRINISVHHGYLFCAEKFKKYTEYQLSTHCGLSYYEKVTKKNSITKTSIRVKEGNDTYGMVLEYSTDRSRIMMEVNKNYKDVARISMPFKDCDIGNIFNKYIMFEFDLTSDQKVFDVVDKVRTLLVKHVNDTYNKMKEKGINPTVFGAVRKRIEVLESDEYQVQKRP